MVEIEQNQPSFEEHELLMASHDARKLLLSQWRYARDHLQDADADLIMKAYRDLQSFLITYGAKIEDIENADSAQSKGYVFDSSIPLFVVGEMILSRFAARWRFEKSHDNKRANQIVKIYHQVVKFLWDKGWRGDMMPDGELPENLMPVHYIDYWRRKGSL